MGAAEFSWIYRDFAKQGMMDLLGARLTDVERGQVEIHFDAHQRYSQHHGFMHAGLATSIVDSACGFAAISTAGPDREVLTIEFKINFLAPAKHPQFKALGRVIKAGRRVVVCEGDVFGIEDGQLMPIVRMQATMMLIRHDG